jgi:outer membrane protein insertion porin family
MTEHRTYFVPRRIVLWTCWWSTIFLLLTAPVQAQWPVGPTRISFITYRVSEEGPKGYDWEAVGTALIDLKVGDEVTPEILDRALARFEPVGDAEADTVFTDSAVALTIELRPHRRVKTIRIKGVYPLFERDVRSVMTIGPGSIFDPEVLDDQAELIAQRYRREGYIAPDVLLLRERDPDDGHILVTVQIEKGPAYRSAEVDIVGNQVFSVAQIKEYLAGRRWRKGLFGSKRFSDQQIEADLDSLTQFYRQKGYADVRITSDIS